VTAIAAVTAAVLPATTSLERDHIGFATREGFYIAMRRAVAPHGEAPRSRAARRQLSRSALALRLHPASFTRARAIRSGTLRAFIAFRCNKPAPAIRRRAW